MILVCIVVIGLFNTCGSGDKVLRYNLTVINNTGIDIYAFYASERDVDNWEEDVLGNDILYAGDSVNIEFTITEDDLDWDFAMEDMYGNMIEFYGLSLLIVISAEQLWFWSMTVMKGRQHYTRGI